MKKVIVAFIAVLFSSSAFAIGDREKGVLAGVAGLWIFQQLSRPPVVVQQGPVYSPAPVYAPAPVVTQPQIVYQQAPAVSPTNVFVFPNNYPVPSGMSCTWSTEVINGQLVTGNFCFAR